MSDTVEQLKKTPLHPKQKWTLALLGLVILASGFVLGASTMLFCFQRGFMGPPSKPPGEWVRDLTRPLDLTPEQQAQITPIFERQHQQFVERRRQWRAKMEENKKQMMAEIESILTPDQFTKFKELFKAHTDRRRRGRGHGSNKDGRRGSNRSGRRGPRPHDPNTVSDPNQ